MFLRKNKLKKKKNQEDPSQLWIATAGLWLFALAWPCHCFFYLFVLPFFVVEILFIQFSGLFQRELFHSWNTSWNYSVCKFVVTMGECEDLPILRMAILSPPNSFFHLQNKCVITFLFVLSSVIWILDVGKSKEHVFHSLNPWSIRHHHQS